VENSPAISYKKIDKLRMLGMFFGKGISVKGFMHSGNAKFPEGYQV
jgi:hypothetical protein